MNLPAARFDRIPTLDGLRGIACLLVFGVHFGQLTKLDGSLGPFELARLLTNGNTGVALFFALSGMLLSLPFWAAKQGSGPSVPLGSYFLRRCARILPAYYLCLAVLVIANRIWNKTNGWADIGLHLTFVFNYAEWSVLSINAPFWTLAVEMQFYLLLPLLFVLLRPAGLQGSSAAIVLLAVACYAFNYVLIESMTKVPAGSGAFGQTPRISPVLVYSLLGHMPHFLLGVLAGRLYLCLTTAETGVQKAVGLGAGFSLALIFVVIGTPLDEFLQIPHGRYNLPYVPLLLMVLVATAPFARYLHWLLDGWLLRGIGLISYGIYIFHMPILNATSRYMKNYFLPPDTHWILFGAVSFTVTLAVAAGSYLLIERPVLLGTARLSRREGK